MHACPPATIVAKAPRGKGPRTRRQAIRLRAARHEAARLDQARPVRPEKAELAPFLLGVTVRRGRLYIP